MEVPDFCRRASARVTRKRKTPEDVDPDYEPDSSSRNSIVPVERKKVIRSKIVEMSRRKPPPGLKFIERPEYSVEDWREKAADAKKSRKSSGRKKATSKVAAKTNHTTDGLVTLEYSAGGQVAPLQGNQELVLDDAADYEAMWNIVRQQPFVMGAGKGQVGGPPEFEFKSLWNFELKPITKDDCFGDMTLPWLEKDTTVPDVAPTVLSIVACFSVGRTLDVEKIALSSNNVEYNPDRFAPLVMRMREPKSTALIFRTGRIIVTGTKSEVECKKAARRYARIIQKLGYRVKVLNFHIQNIAAACNLKFRVRLNQLSKNKMYGKLSYEPELFPGLEIPLECPKVKVIIFGTGSILMTGAKSEEDLNTALQIIYPLARMYAP